MGAAIWSAPPARFRQFPARFIVNFFNNHGLLTMRGHPQWKTVQGVKQPWFISLKSGAPMAFAGLWENWRPDTEEATKSCCIITTDANALMAPIHDRMPVILDREEWATWLSPQEHRADQLLPLIRPHEADTMQAWQVTRELNKAGLRDDAGLVERVA